MVKAASQPEKVQPSCWGAWGGSGVPAVGHGLGVQSLAGDAVHEGDGEGDGLELGPDGVAGGQLAEGVAADSAHALAVHQHVGEDIALVGVME